MTDDDIPMTNNNAAIIAEVEASRTKDKNAVHAALADQLRQYADLEVIPPGVRASMIEASHALRASLPSLPQGGEPVAATIERCAQMLEAEAKRYGGSDGMGMGATEAVYHGNHVHNILATQAIRMRALTSLPATALDGGGADTTLEFAARLSASEVACYRWPDNADMRQAFCDGAAHIALAANKPDRAREMIAITLLHMNALDTWRSSTSWATDMITRGRNQPHTNDCEGSAHGCVRCHIDHAFAAADAIIALKPHQ